MCSAARNAVSCLVPLLPTRLIQPAPAQRVNVPGRSRSVPTTETGVKLAMPESSDAEYIPPLVFASDVLGVKLWDKQQEVLAALPDHRRVAVKSGNGLGKGFSAAVAVLWFLHCHNPAIVLSTAPTFRQVRHILWRQIRRLYRPAKEKLDGKMLDTRWELAEDRYAMGLSADSADEFQGFHSPNMFYRRGRSRGCER